MTGGWIVWGLVAAGGALGSVSRVALIHAFDTRGSLWGVAVVNVLGASFFVITLALLSRQSGLTLYLKTLLLSGFLGAFTTFSTFTYQSWTLWQQGRWFDMLAFVAVNLLGSLAAFFLGAWVLHYGYSS